MSSCRYVTYPDPQKSITPYLPFKFKIGKSEFTFPVEFQELFGVVLCAWIFSRYVLLFSRSIFFIGFLIFYKLRVFFGHLFWDKI